MTLHSWRIAATLALLVIPAAVGILDVIFYAHGGYEATVSKLCLDLAARYPLFPLVLAFLLGVLCGHLFCPQYILPK